MVMTGCGGSRLLPLHNGSRKSDGIARAVCAVPLSCVDCLVGSNVGIVVGKGENGSEASQPPAKESSKPLCECVAVEEDDDEDCPNARGGESELSRSIV